MHGNIILKLKSGKEFKLTNNEKYIVITEDWKNWVMMFKFCKDGLGKYPMMYYNIPESKSIHKISAAYFKDYVIDLELIKN